MNKSYSIILPRGIEVDVFNLPEDFDRIVLRCFAEYTGGTSADYRDVDRLGFMDVLVRRLNKRWSDAEDLVDELVKDRFVYEWHEGNMLTEDDIYCPEFLNECCEEGMKVMELGGPYGISDHHIYDEVHKVVARVMRIVATATEEQLKEALKEGEDGE